MVIVPDVLLASADHIFHALADPTRREIFERLARRQRKMTCEPYQNLRAHSGKDKVCKSN
jgi:DNA-binding transcriptional ArsR family regulator